MPLGWELFLHIFKLYKYPSLFLHHTASKHLLICSRSANLGTLQVSTHLSCQHFSPYLPCISFLQPGESMLHMPSQPFQLRLVDLYHVSLSNLQSYFRFSDTYWEALSNSTCLISKCYCANSAVTDTTKHSEQCLAHGIYNFINATVLQGTRQQHAFVIITSMSSQEKPLEASSGTRKK